MRQTPPPTSQHQPLTNQASKASRRPRVKGLEANPELTKLVKCQQNADRLNQPHRDTRTYAQTQGLNLSSDSGFLTRAFNDTDYGHDGRLICVSYLKYSMSGEVAEG